MAGRIALAASRAGDTYADDDVVPLRASPRDRLFFQFQYTEVWHGTCRRAPQTTVPRGRAGRRPFSEFEEEGPAWLGFGLPDASDEVMAAFSASRDAYATVRVWYADRAALQGQSG